MNPSRPASLPAGYFERMYDAATDPWGFQDRWYEARKRALTLAALPQARFRRAFEPGCSIGVLTRDLAGRCDELLATDVSAAAVASARARLADRPHVRVAQQAVPGDWPAGRFDLIVLSEVGYYLDEAGLAELARLAAASLTPGGTLLACHWRHEVADYPTTGDHVHHVLRGAGGLVPAVDHVEEDLRLEVWTRGETPSPARRERLV